MASSVAFTDLPHAIHFSPLTSQQYASHYRHTRIPLVLDLGTFEFRCGFAHETSPRLSFRPFVGKSKGTVRSPDFYCKIGPQLSDHERVKLRARTPFDHSLLSYYETLEHVLDFALLHCGLGAESGLEHPIVCTEVVTNPNFCRGRLSELLFEGYSAPSVAYGIDALFAWRYNTRHHILCKGEKDGVILCSGHSSTHLIPVVDSQPMLLHAARMSIGGSTAHSLVEADLINDYPQHRAQITLPRAQELVERFAQFVTEDYDAELRKIALWVAADPAANLRSIVPTKKEQLEAPCIEPVIIQLPFVPVLASTITEEEMQAKEQRKKENADRLRGLLAKKREQMIEKLEEDIQSYENLKEQKLSGQITHDQYLGMLHKGDFENEIDFENTLANFKRRLWKAQNGEEEAVIEQQKPDIELYPLLHVLDAELTTDQIKDKRRQRSIKQAADMRIKRREEKLLQEQRQAAQEAEEKNERLADPIAYVAKLRSTKASILSRRQQRTISESSQGRKSAISRKRMKLLASQMGDKERQDNPNAPQRPEKDDRFGMNDADWDIYKEAALPSAPQESDEDSDVERNELQLLEQKLALYDPQYQSPTMNSKLQLTEADFQLNFYVDRIRAPELLYKPSMIGIQESGLTEALRRLLVRMDESQADRVARTLFVTGGATLYPNFDERLKNEYTSIRPVGSEWKLVRAIDPSLDAWRGAAMLALDHHQYPHNNSLSSSSQPLVYISRQQYEECGSDYLAEHSNSNVYYPTPTLGDDELKALKKRKAPQRSY